MAIYNSEQWMKDLDQAIAVLPELKTLENKTVFITGATGLICSAVADILFRYNDTHENAIHVCCAGRSYERIKSRFQKYCDKEYFTFAEYDATEELHLDADVDYIIHGAGNAFPSIIMKEPVETMASNFIGLLSLFNYAKNHETKRILYISSSEIYGQKETLKPYEETEYGYIDLLNPRNSYSVSKRAAETLCVSYAHEYNVEAVIVRPGHIYGPTASSWDNRVSSIFAYDAAKGKDLIMKSEGSQIRSYCYCVDCASAILKVLLCGENCNAYNISNPASIISIRQMAELLAEAGNVRLIRESASQEEQKSYNPMQNSSLDSTRLEALGWTGCFNAKTGLTNTVNILKDRLKG